MKKFHVVRVSIFNLADKLEHEKAQGEQEMNFKLRKLPLAQSAIKTATVREGLRLRAYPQMPVTDEYESNLASDMESRRHKA